MHDRDYEREGYNKGRRSMYDRDYESDYTGWSPFVVGAFIAGGVALLLAPQTGPKLRGTIRSYASSAADEVAERGREAWGRGKEAWDTAVERGKEYMETGRQAMSEAGRSAREFGETGKEAIRTGKEADQGGQESRKEAGRGRGSMYDRDYESDYTRRFAFVPGAFIGAGVALLMAPQTGSELRGMIRSYASRATDKIAERGREAWGTAVERGKEYMETGRQAMSEAGRSAREYGKTGKEAIRTGKEAVQGGKEPNKEAVREKESNKEVVRGATTNH